MQFTPLLEFLNIGGSEMILIVIAILLLFGGKKLPELARGLGKGIREFKDASEGVKREIHRNINAVDIDKEEDSAQTYREPEEDNGYSIHHDDTEPVADHTTEQEPAPTAENNEPKSSV